LDGSSVFFYLGLAWFWLTLGELHISYFGQHAIYMSSLTPHIGLWGTSEHFPRIKRMVYVGLSGSKSWSGAPKDDWPTTNGLLALAAVPPVRDRFETGLKPVSNWYWSQTGLKPVLNRLKVFPATFTAGS
jgi:hypothetical protein